MSVSNTYHGISVSVKAKFANLVLCILLGCSIMFLSACKKENTGGIDGSELVGTKWQHQTDVIMMNLHFIDHETLSIQSGKKDDSYSVNVITYSWQYATEEDDGWGIFHVYNIIPDGQKGELVYSGTLENGKVLLKRTDNAEDLWFTRSKKK